MSVYEGIQRCKWQGKSKSATARELKLARGTVRKFWRMSEEDYAGFCKDAAYRRRRMEKYREEIIDILQKNAADGHRVYVSSIYDVLEERHGRVDGNQRTLGNFIRMLRDTGAVAENPKGRVRRPQEEVEAGSQCQVDFGELRISSGAKVYMLVAVLAYSRSRYVVVQDHRFRTMEVILALLKCLAFFGGRPRTLVIDQDKLMTASENGGEIIHTAEFRSFLEEQEIRVWLCRKSDPQSKGKVENAVKFVKSSFFSARQFMSVEAVHKPLEKWLIRRANGRICQATGRVLAVVLEREEAPTLRPLRVSVYEGRRRFEDIRKTDEKGMISFEGNRFSVPEEYAGATVEVGKSARHVVIHDRDTGGRIASHRIPEGKGRSVVAAHHRIPIGQKADEAYRELARAWESPLWRGFLAANQEHYRRYWKEQSRLLRRLVDSVDNGRAFEAALDFALESQSYGAGDLRHAYSHLEQADKLNRKPLLDHVEPLMAARREAKVEVAKRGIGYYSSFVSLIFGVLA